MQPSASVLAALETALQVAPDDVGLRNHYAQLLADAGKDAQALEICTRTLALDPVNVAALRVALRAARATQHPAAAGYAQLLQALGGAEPPAPAAPAGSAARRCAAAGRESAARLRCRGREQRSRRRGRRRDRRSADSGR